MQRYVIWCRRRPENKLKHKCLIVVIYPGKISLIVAGEFLVWNELLYTLKKMEHRFLEWLCECLAPAWKMNQLLLAELQTMYVTILSGQVHCLSRLGKSIVSFGGPTWSDHKCDWTIGSSIVPSLAHWSLPNPKILFLLCLGSGQP